MKKIVLQSMLAFLLTAALLGPGSVAAAEQVTLKIEDQGQPVAAAEVVIFLSCDRIEATTDALGAASFDIECGGRGFWVEVDGKRLAEFYWVGRVPEKIDVASVGYMAWGGE